MSEEFSQLVLSMAFYSVGNQGCTVFFVELYYVENVRVGAWFCLVADPVTPKMSSPRYVFESFGSSMLSSPISNDSVSGNADDRQ